MKKYIYYSLFGLNLVALILAILQMVLFGIGYSQKELQTILTIRFNLTFFILIFIIWNIVIWAKKDKKIGRILALFFSARNLYIVLLQSSNKKQILGLTNVN